MKKILVTICICLGTLYCFAQDKKTAPLHDIVKQISESWQDVDETNRNGIKLQSVTALFSVSKTTTLGGEIKIWIFKLGKKVEKNKVSKVTLALTKGDESKRSIRNSRAKSELTKFINATLADFKKLEDDKLLPDLTKRTVTIEIGLTITKSGGAGGELEIGIFSFSGEAGRNADQGNTLILEFSKE